MSHTDAMCQFTGELPKHLKRPVDSGYVKRWLAMKHYQPDLFDRQHSGQALLGGPWKNTGTDTAHRWLQKIVGYQTASKNMLTLLVDAVSMHRSEVPLLTEYESFALCGDCAGSNGGCPGYAPLFEEVAKAHQFVFIIAVHMDMAWTIQYCSPRSGVQLMRSSYTDRLTEHYTDRINTYLNKARLGLSLAMGNCNGCQSPVDCTVIVGKQCQHPNLRTFSMEATGIDVDELHHMLYGEYLPWYYNGSGNLYPTYMSRYILYFGDAREFAPRLNGAIVADQSYIKAERVPAHIELPTELQVIPRGVHAGYRQYVYNTDDID